MTSETTTEKIYTENCYIAYVMGVNGPKATGFSTESESEAWKACEANCGPLDVANIITDTSYSCTLPDLGPCWNNIPSQLNQQDVDWVVASDDPEDWPTNAIGFYHNIHTGNPAIFVTGLNGNGEWADPESNNAPVCSDCISAASTSSDSIEGVSGPEDFVDADDYEQGEDDPEYKAAIANFEFTYKKLDTPGDCWSCVQMYEESSSEYPEE